MARLSEETKNEIRNRARIEEIIGRYVPLVGTRKSPKCICPFHDDHDPSLSISIDQQIFKCFVCGAAGNVFGFVSKFEHISYEEAIYKVADMVDYPLEHVNLTPQYVDPYPQLHKIMQDSIKFSQYQLSTDEGKYVMDYLLKRGLSPKQIQDFELGFMPRNYPLHEFLKKKGYSLQDMVSTNVATVNENGVHDVFFERMTIPIHDEHGYPVGFTARTLQKDNERKYINTSQTPIYQKGNVVFNYHRAKAECRKEGKVLIVEGPMDLFAFDEAGIKHVVATLGTSFTDEQMALVRKLSSHVILAYDGDKAGQNAIYKAGNQLIGKGGFDVQVLDNQTGLDPDEILRERGKETLVKMATKPITWIEFVYRYMKDHFDLGNYSQKREFAMRICTEIKRLPNDFDRQVFLGQLEKDTGFAQGQLETLLNGSKQPVQQQTNRPQRQVVQQPWLDGRLMAEYEILNQILKSLKLFEIFKNELGCFSDENNQKIFMYLMEYYRTHTEVVVADFLDYLPEEALQNIILRISDWELIRKNADEEVLTGAMNKVKDYLLQDQITNLKRQVESERDPNKKAQLSMQYVALLQKRNQSKCREGE